MSQFEKSRAEQYYFDHDLERATLLTREEEINLGRKAQAGDIDARNALVEGNLRLVIKVAKTVFDTRLSFADKVAAGNLGLIHSANAYDPDYGNGKIPFGPFAFPRIRWEIEHEVSRQGLAVNLPTNSQNATAKINRAINAHLVEHRREPDRDEIVARTGLNPSLVDGAVMLKKGTVALVQHNPKDYAALAAMSEEVITYEDDEAPDEAVTVTIDKEYLAELMSAVTPRHAEVLRLRYGLDLGHTRTEQGYGRTLDEVGDILGFTRERARQLEQQAFADIRGKLRRDAVVRAAREVAA